MRRPRLRARRRTRPPRVGRGLQASPRLLGAVLLAARPACGVALPALCAAKPARVDETKPHQQGSTMQKPAIGWAWEFQSLSQERVERSLFCPHRRHVATHPPPKPHPPAMDARFSLGCATNATAAMTAGQPTCCKHAASGMKERRRVCYCQRGAWGAIWSSTPNGASSLTSKPVQPSKLTDSLGSHSLQHTVPLKCWKPRRARLANMCVFTWRKDAPGAWNRAQDSDQRGSQCKFGR